MRKPPTNQRRHKGLEWFTPLQSCTVETFSPGIIRAEVTEGVVPSVVGSVPSGGRR